MGIFKTFARAITGFNKKDVAFADENPQNAEGEEPRDDADQGKPPDMSRSTWNWFKRKESNAQQLQQRAQQQNKRKQSLWQSLIFGKQSQALSAPMPTKSVDVSNKSGKITQPCSTNDKSATSQKLSHGPPAGCDPNIPSTPQTRTAFLKVSGYTMEREVDSGAFANVYMVRTSDDRRPFAAKRINLLAKTNKKFIGKFLPREIWCHAQLKHSCLIRYWQTLVASSDIYMIMDWVPRGNMLDHCRLKGRLDEREAKVIMYQLCSGLAYMHVNTTSYTATSNAKICSSKRTSRCTSKSLISDSLNLLDLTRPA